MKIKQSINLIQGYYHFLYMGKYLDNYIKKENLSTSITPTIIATGDDTNFTFNQQTLMSLFASAHKHADKDNVFGYMVELNAIRGIIFTTRELIENSDEFKRFLQERISRQYFPFEQIVKFVRNVLAHSYDPQLTIKKEDFSHQKAYRSSKGINTIHFFFKYYHYREEWTGDKEYGLDIQIRFDKLKPGTPLYTAISLHQLYLICELCYNLTKLFNSQKTISTTKKTEVKKTSPNTKKSNKKNQTKTKTNKNPNKQIQKNKKSKKTKQ